jgi:hypothetical protein
MADDGGIPGSGSWPSITIAPEVLAKAQAALNSGVPLVEDSTREELMAYHYLLKSAHDKLEEMRQQLDDRKRAADASSE